MVAGHVVRLRSPRHALTHGLVGIAQELSLVPATTVLDNVMLGTESTRAGFVDRRAQRARFAEIEAHYGFELDPDAVVRDLNVAAQQRVELLRALGRRAALVVMDEPTARLTMGEAMALRGVIRMLAAEGTAIVYVSHFLDEVLAVSDEVTVMRDGRIVRTGPAAAETPETLLEGMVGRTIGSTFPPKVPVPPDAPVRLAVDGLARPGEFGPGVVLRSCRRDRRCRRSRRRRSQRAGPRRRRLDEGRRPAASPSTVSRCAARASAAPSPSGSISSPSRGARRGS